MAPLLPLLLRAQPDSDGKEREVMIIWRVDDKLRTLKRKKKEKKEKSAFGCVKKTHIQAYINVSSFLSISSSFAVIVSVLSLFLLVVAEKKREKKQHQQTENRRIHLIKGTKKQDQCPQSIAFDREIRVISMIEDRTLMICS